MPLTLVEVIPMERCDDYMGEACLNGSCPRDNDCYNCPFYEGCSDCTLYLTNLCSDSMKDHFQRFSP